MLTAITSRRSALLALAGLCVAGAAGAQSYPTKPVRIIVSYAAGGGVDMMARVLAEQLGKQMGQTFVVENKPGASGTIGADAVAKSAPDGYTLLAGGNPELTFMQAVNDKLPYQPLRDLAPLMLVANVPSVLVVNAASPIRTMAQFMERARDAKGLPYGTPGRGTPMHLAFELMNQLHGTKLIHVPYKGGGPATADVVGGQIEVAVINAPPVLPQIHAGKLRALAVLQNERSPAAARRADLEGSHRHRRRASPGLVRTVDARRRAGRHPLAARSRAAQGAGSGRGPGHAGQGRPRCGGVARRPHGRADGRRGGLQPDDRQAPGLQARVRGPAS